MTNIEVLPKSQPKPAPEGRYETTFISHDAEMRGDGTIAQD
jgi:hypothetical protein